MGRLLLFSGKGFPLLTIVPYCSVLLVNYFGIKRKTALTVELFSVSLPLPLSVKQCIHSLRGELVTYNTVFNPRPCG
jgi:hypothetical protein